MIFEFLVCSATLTTITLLSKIIYEDLVYNNIHNLSQIELMPYSSYSRVLY